MSKQNIPPSPSRKEICWLGSRRPLVSIMSCLRYWPCGGGGGDLWRSGSYRMGEALLTCHQIGSEREEETGVIRRTKTAVGKNLHSLCKYKYSSPFVDSLNLSEMLQWQYTSSVQQSWVQKQCCSESFQWDGNWFQMLLWYFKYVNKHQVCVHCSYS